MIASGMYTTIVRMPKVGVRNLKQSMARKELRMPRRAGCGVRNGTDVAIILSVLNSPPERTVPALQQGGLRMTIGNFVAELQRSPPDVARWYLPVWGVPPGAVLRRDHSTSILSGASTADYGKSYASQHVIWGINGRICGGVEKILTGGGRPCGLTIKAGYGSS